ncbi:hypothetical protein PAXINDRAFT_102608 [Paxillus involutus ATCC 200175]|uniref:C2H2-type domain-containing protein n=1 Tax=Paxillus involutus ATCC 200175 TaxID=664439 RepID=A0A0C9SNQ6_PAXIN|nr:hypothetical protein PAXINDRAFT_102608 [Paxillus involutus ATCC 200175]
MSHLNHYTACDAPISEPNDILRLDREMNDISAYPTQTTDALCTSAQWDDFLFTNFPGWTQDLHPLPQDQIDPWFSYSSFQSLDEQTTSLGFEPPISGPLVSHLPSVAGSDMVQANTWHFGAPSPIQPDVHQHDFRDKAPAAHHADTIFSWSTPDSVYTAPNNAYGGGIPSDPKPHPPITRQPVCPSTTFPSDSWGRLPPRRSGGPQTHECQWAADGTWCGALVQGDRREVMLHLNEKHGIPLTGDKVPQMCLWQGCRSSMRRESIARHIVAVHMKERVHCAKCGSSFARNDSLQRHLRGGKEETCNGKPDPQRGCQPFNGGLVAMNGD